MGAVPETDTRSTSLTHRDVHVPSSLSKACQLLSAGTARSVPTAPAEPRRTQWWRLSLCPWLPGHRWYCFPIENLFRIPCPGPSHPQTQHQDSSCQYSSLNCQGRGEPGEAARRSHPAAWSHLSFRHLRCSHHINVRSGLLERGASFCPVMLDVDLHVALPMSH